MTLKAGYTSKDVVKEGPEVYRGVKIDGHEYKQIVVLLHDRVGRTIGHRALTPLV